MRNKDWVARARGVSDLKAHLVLTTKYRKDVLTSKRLDRLQEITNELMQKWDCRLIEFNGESDHIHILFQYHPQVSLPKLINNIKSVSSRYMRKEFEQHVNKFYWKDLFGNGSYFIASCGRVTVAVLKQYVQSQNKPTS
jgi:putative transposase